MITYVSNRIFRHIKPDTVNRDSGNNGLDTLFFEEASTGSIKPSVAKAMTGIEAHEYPMSYGVSAKEMAFSFYILSI
jgi:hypothetical protein